MWAHTFVIISRHTLTIAGKHVCPQSCTPGHAHKQKHRHRVRNAYTHRHMNTVDTHACLRLHTDTHTDTH
jgi:hypothetical protein